MPLAYNEVNTLLLTQMLTIVVDVTAGTRHEAIHSVNMKVDDYFLL